MSISLGGELSQSVRRGTLILRGKRFGLRLDGILEILGVAGAAQGELSEVEQLHRALLYGAKHMRDLDERIEELQALRKELMEHGLRVVERLGQLGEDMPGEASAFTEGNDGPVGHQV